MARGHWQTLTMDGFTCTLRRGGEGAREFSKPHAPTALPHIVRELRAIMLIVAEEECHRAREEAAEVQIMRSSPEHHYFPPPHDPSISR